MGKDTTNGRKGKNSKKAKKIKVIALVILILVLLTIVVGAICVKLYQQWEARYDSNTSVVFILEDGQVVSNDVIAFDTSKYDQTELGLFIEETIDTYNRESGEDLVVQEELVVEDNIASLILTYADAATYEDFSGTELFLGSISEAVAAGYQFDGQFASIVNGKAVATTVDKFYDQADLKVAIIKANTKVQVEGEILYVSSENVSRVGENWIIIKEDANLLGSGASKDTETTETESETGTETEMDTDQSDGSVDELVTEEEETSTEIIFDFGDEEAPEEDDTYSEVYTYIIYK